eukprot:SAG11_NODE_6984_length_1214_cov_1.324664_1_plen_99_part_10
MGYAAPSVLHKWSSKGLDRKKEATKSEEIWVEQQCPVAEYVGKEVCVARICAGLVCHVRVGGVLVCSASAIYLLQQGLHTRRDISPPVRTHGGEVIRLQ